MRACLLVSFALAGCVVHSTQSIESPDWNTLVGPNRHGEIRLTGDSGRSTGWMDRDNLVVSGSTVCVRSDERRWKRVTMVRISQLDGANVPALLANLPTSVAVVHPQDGSGEIELHTYGADLTKWLTSKRHDASDVGVPRYRIQTWGTWRGPMTWQQLADAGVPKVGWRISRLATIEVRKVNIPGTVILSIAVAPLLVGAVALALVVRVPVPHDEPRPPPSDNIRAADVPLALISAGIAANAADDDDPAAPLRATLCDDIPAAVR